MRPRGSSRRQVGRLGGQVFPVSAVKFIKKGCVNDVESLWS